MGILLGSKKLYNYCKLFGFGEKNRNRNWRGADWDSSSPRKMGWFDYNKTTYGACSKYDTDAGAIVPWQQLQMVEF